MGIEIERKFIVPGSFPAATKKYTIKQGYVSPVRGSVSIEDNFLLFLNRNNKELFRLSVGPESKDILKDINNDKSVLILDNKNVVRIRVRDNKGFITIKGNPTAKGTPEYEYGIPLTKANTLLEELTDKYLNKVRHIIPAGDKIWEVDQFKSPADLTLAEIELSKPDEHVDIPSWVGKEVTGDPKYFNSEIVKAKESSVDFVGVYLSNS